MTDLEDEGFSSLDFLNFIPSVEDEDYVRPSPSYGVLQAEKEEDSDKDVERVTGTHGELASASLCDGDTVTNTQFLQRMTKYSYFLEGKYDGIDNEHPSVQNIVASVHLGCELDLREIAISTRNAEYNPRKFHALILRLQNPKVTGLVFRTGRLVITGAKSLEVSKTAAKRIAKLIRKELGEKIVFNEFKVENVIASFKLKRPIRLELFYEEYKPFCNYEPEIFAGLVYRFELKDREEAVLLIFVSGNVIITGCRSYEEICYIHSKMMPLLRDFKN